MNITSVMLKDKSIKISSYSHSSKMNIEINRINMMPKNVLNNTLQCEFRLEIKITDEKSVELLKISLGYIINANLDGNETYEQNLFADRLFKVLESMYINNANELLIGTPFPPIPFNIIC